MENEDIDSEALRLVRAFFKISDPDKRRELIELVEKIAEQEE